MGPEARHSHSCRLCHSPGSVDCGAIAAAAAPLAEDALTVLGLAKQREKTSAAWTQLQFEDHHGAGSFRGGRLPSGAAQAA